MLGLAFTTPTAFAQNDECSTALPLTGAGVGFDTQGNTLSPEAWTCGFISSAPDVWYSYVAVAPFPVTLESCGANYDSMLQVFSGTCGALVALACNDDACGLQSRVTFTPTLGATYYVRVGGYGAASGQGTLTVQESAGTHCLVTTLLSNNQGAVGGAIYFDHIFAQSVIVTGSEAHLTAPAGTPVGLLVWITFGSHVGNESNPAAWFPVGFDDGTTVSAGRDALTSFRWSSPIVVPAGMFGTCLIATNSGHRYTNGSRSAVTPDGVITLIAGSASNQPFTAPIFTPRSWNGAFCYELVVGTSYCGPAVPNSTGAPAYMRAAGSALVAENDLTIAASNMPPFSAAFFLASPAQGNWPNPGGSLGNLCLGGAIGRAVGGGNFTVNPNGNVSTYVDLTRIPTPILVTVPVQPGDTYHFQAWYRDNVGGAAVSNFTDAISVSFL